MIEVVEPGPLTTVQDDGRRGYRAFGVARSGAFDRSAAGLANRLVGNAPGSAVLETTLGGLVIRALDAVTVALTGARCPGLSWGTPITLRAGEFVRLGVPSSGLRSYLAVRGGLLAQLELGSRSTDRLGRLGPAPASGSTSDRSPAPRSASWPRRRPRRVHCGSFPAHAWTGS